MLTCGSFFSGGGLADIGFMAAGFVPIFGVEYTPEIADSYNANIGDHCRVSDVRTVDFCALPYVDLFHASPVCKNASVAKTDGEESAEDIETAEAVCKAIRAIRPRWFTLENVWGYRNFAAFNRILRTLSAGGYDVKYSHENAADYGVCQTRQRLILRAVRGGRVPNLNATHSRQGSDGGLFEECGLQKWIGWYEAIADLIPSLPETQLAKWQLDRLPNGFLESVGVEGTSSSPEFALTVRRAAEPHYTIKASTTNFRAVLVEGTPAGERPPPRSVGGEPAITVNAGGGGRVHRAVLVSAAPSVGLADSQRPAFAVVSVRRSLQSRAVLIDGDNAGKNGPITHEASRPATTINTQSRPVALADCRVVKLTPRCLARFQSLPDWYVLPGKNSLATTIIGNGFACRLAQAVAESLKGKTT